MSKTDLQKEIYIQQMMDSYIEQSQLGVILLQGVASQMIEQKWDPNMAPFTMAMIASTINSIWLLITTSLSNHPGNQMMPQIDFHIDHLIPSLVSTQPEYVATYMKKFTAKIQEVMDDLSSFEIQTLYDILQKEGMIKPSPSREGLQ